MDLEKIVREYIDKTIHMSLATANGNYPWVCEVHFAYDENLNLYFRSVTSRRHSKEIERNPNVAGNIVRQYKVGEPCDGAVYFEGVAELLKDNDSKRLAADCLKSRLDIPKDILEESSSEESLQFYKITIKNWYLFGISGVLAGQKHKLEWSKTSV